MNNSKNTKRALISSAIALIVCISMLIGSTYAWFTDTVTSNNNIIKAGNLDVDLLYSKDTTSWHSVTSGTNIFGSSLWEPGHTEVIYLKIKNQGTLDLKYQLGINIVSETTSTSVTEKELKLSNFIKFGVVENASYYGNDDAARTAAIAAIEADAKLISAGYTKNTTGLEAGVTTDAIALVVYMPTAVGNDANYKTGEAVPEIKLGLNLMATQLASESDSFGSTYDASATYPVTDLSGLKSALESGKSVTVTENITVTEAINVSGDVVINLSGGTLDASALKLNRPFHMTEGANLTINGGDETVTLGDHGLVNVPTTVKNASVTINGGTYTGTTANGTLVRLRAGNEKVDVVLNDVTYSDDATNGYIVSTSGFSGEGSFVVNGGSYAANYGFQLCNLTATLTGVTINTNSTAVEAYGDEVTVDDCEINVDPGSTVVNAPGSAIAASAGGKATVKNSTITGSMQAVYYIYNSGGEIVATNNDISSATTALGTYRDDATSQNMANGKITIDGRVVSPVS